MILNPGTESSSDTLKRELFDLAQAYKDRDRPMGQGKGRGVTKPPLRTHRKKG